MPSVRVGKLLERSVLVRGKFCDGLGACFGRLDLQPIHQYGFERHALILRVGYRDGASAPVKCVPDTGLLACTGAIDHR